MAYKESSIYLCAFVFVLIILAGNAQWEVHDEENNDCQTPDHFLGSCIPIYSCKSVNDFLNKVPQPITAKIRNFLQALHCGFNGNTPKVCCSETLKFPKITAQENTVPSPPDVSNHRNINQLPKNCGLSPTTERIVYGNKTGLFDFPWMALLSYKTGGGPKFNCGGTIINNRYILTAAHCITHIRNPLLGVRVGEHNIQTATDCETSKEGVVECAPPYRDLAIEEIIPHSEYDRGSGSNDIGLLRVRPMDLSVENIKPVCLPLNKARNYNFTDRKAVVTGWGFTESGKSSPDLLRANVPMVPLNECQTFYAKHRKINYLQLCAGGKSKSDSCRGDSGGPLCVLTNLYDDVRFVQHGIVSFGPTACGKSELPGVYTGVAYYMDWILDNIKP